VDTIADWSSGEEFASYSRAYGGNTFNGAKMFTEVLPTLDLGALDEETQTLLDDFESKIGSGMSSEEMSAYMNHGNGLLLA
jgi:hypothetical protein